ncbi:hypothetical protein HHK36_011462 [Tetracentron sinense]|uniref:Uncharacterized protein n=1 Tax=Tetracentron sinense TaxID=13715 RepID=A0A834ZCR1_TETSI|nr:hypothetical protein HHK36_011462 [Tetracentron sinense]
MFGVFHTRRDGTFVDQTSEQSHGQMTEMLSQHLECTKSSTARNEVFTKEEQALLIRLYASINSFITHSLEEDDEPKRRGSVPGHIILNCRREECHIRLWNDYFSKNPTFGESLFHRRFQICQSLFLRIVDAIKDHDNYFMQKKYGIDRIGLSTLQKVTTVFRILAYGASADSTDEYVRIGASTTILCMKKFCRAIVEVFGDEYLRTPNANDIARLLKKCEERGFSEMLESLDLMHWAWKNYPMAWAGQYSGHYGSPTIIFEAVYFDLPDSNNDINVL